MEDTDLSTSLFEFSYYFIMVISAKSHRQNFCAALSGGAATALSLCTGEPHAPQNRLIIRAGIGSAYWRDLRLTMGRFRPETRNAEN